MIIRTLILLFFFSESTFCQEVVQRPARLIAAPGTITSSSVTVLWNKPVQYNNIKGYEILKDGKIAGHTSDCNYKVADLMPRQTYNLSVKALDSQGNASSPSNLISVKTLPRSDTLNVTDFGAKGDAIYMNTRAIQRAIDGCPPGGIVYIPKGTFLTGALFLKSDMTFYISEGGTLLGSTAPADYEPLINNRFEGWELKTYASLLNAGKMDRRRIYNAENISIRGEGTISGGGEELASAMIAKLGIRGRGRLICLLNCRNVAIEGLKIENSPCWTIHYVYSKNITCSGLDINSSVANGDGIDPDSSDDCYIFNCTFSTSDDCIAIKSGKNPEGYTINRPSENIFITHCNFVKGHGISIGSEMSGGVRNVLVRDSRAGNLIYGLQIKATKERGGFVEQVVVKDCDIQKITILTSLGYNNDGKAAPVMPFFRDFEFSNLDLSKADSGQTLITINGFPDEKHYTRNLIFRNLILPENSSVKIKESASLTFINVLSSSGKKPIYILDRTKNVSY